MSGRFKARNRVALVGFAHSKATRKPDRPLGLTALETARAAIADAGLKPEQIDGFVSSPLLPSTGDHVVEDGISTVTSNWLARHLGLDPAYVVGFQGIGQITGSLTLAVNAIASGAADYVLFHRALHLPSIPSKQHRFDPAEIYRDSTSRRGVAKSLFKFKDERLDSNVFHVDAASRLDSAQHEQVIDDRSETLGF